MMVSVHHFQNLNLITLSNPKMRLLPTYYQTHVLEDLRVSMGVYGYEIVNTLITDITPDSSVQRSMNEINGKYNVGIYRDIYM